MFLSSAALQISDAGAEDEEGSAADDSDEQLSRANWIRDELGSDGKQKGTEQEKANNKRTMLKKTCLLARSSATPDSAESTFALLC